MTITTASTTAMWCGARIRGGLEVILAHKRGGGESSQIRAGCSQWLDTSRTHMLNELFLKTGEEICTRLLRQVVSNIG